MSSHQTEHHIDYQKLGQLADEFTALWKRMHALYLDGAAGFSLLHARVVSSQSRARSFVVDTELDSEAFQDTRMFAYEDIFAGEFCTSGISRSTQGDLKARNSPDGENLVALGQLCVTSFYDYWQEYLREEVVRARGLLLEGIDNETKQRILREKGAHDLWGDLRILRNAIVHKRGVATSDVGRCRLIKWFKPGDPITLTAEHMRMIFLALLRYRNELFKQQFPPREFRVMRKSEI
jgi:hypothetical protein